MLKVVCDSVGQCHLCSGCGAAIAHDKTSCEPCPVVETAKCIEVEVLAQNVPGGAFQTRGFHNTTDGNNILPFNPYDLYRHVESGKYIILNS